MDEQHQGRLRRDGTKLGGGFERKHERLLEVVWKCTEERRMMGMLGEGC